MESLAIITIAGTSVAIKNDRNNNDCDTKAGNTSIGIIIPTNKLFEKSVAGKNKRPKTKPIIIEKYAVFSFNNLL
tara:strand:+ start:215 stop:439 length:225 start_codon:yes stop_codon:yes gene_type:complete